MRLRSVIMVLLALCCGAAPKAPVPPDPLIKAASDAAAAGTLSQFVPTVEKELKPLLESVKQADAEKLTRLAALREFGRYFGRIEKPTSAQIETMQWLVNQPQMLNTLMMAVSSADAPDRVLMILSALRADMKDRLEEFPELASAICVVWDTPAKQANDDAKPDLERPLRLMRYYTNARQQFRFDVKHLPWQLAVYVVDNVVSEEEIEWALGRYARRPNIGTVYFDVPYDLNIFFGTGTDGRGERAYTLQNLALIGGVCADQAYFATQVSRCVGVPAVTVAGRGGGGEVAHAWVGYLDERNGQAFWNFEEGRYVEHQYWKGRVVDPQTRQGVLEADVALLAELAEVSPANRAASVALNKVADMREPSQRAALFNQAINLSPGNRQAWLELAELGAQLKLTAAQVAELKGAVAKFAAKPYPDFAYAVLRRSIMGRGTIQQIQALDEMRPMFGPSRPDLLADIDLAQGDLYRQDKRAQQALAAYGNVLEQYPRAGPIVMEAMEHIQELLQDMQDVRRLAGIYQFAWSRLPTPSPSAYARTTPFYILGQRYQELLERLSEPGEAQMVKTRLDSLTASSDATSESKRRR